MYTVGIISKSSCKTYSYESFEEADKQLNNLRQYLLDDNDGVNFTTIIERLTNTEIVSIRHIFRMSSSLEDYILFLQKNSNN